MKRRCHSPRSLRGEIVVSRTTLRQPKRATLGLVVLLLSTSCGGTSAGPSPLASYDRALSASDPSRAALVEKGSATEAAAVRRFIDFYRAYRADVIRAHVRELYANDVYFRDPFHEVQGIEAAEAYFVRSTEGIADCRFDISDWAEHDGNYYFRWAMHLRTKRDPEGPPIEAVGMSHVRFDRNGKVLFQQDYWDAASTVYERIPVVGWVLRKIRNRI